MGYSGSHANGSYLVYMPDTKKFVVSRNVKFNEGKCDEVIRAAQATIARMEEFEAGASKIRTMVDEHTTSESEVPPDNELSRERPDSDTHLDPMNPETGTNEEITKAGKIAAAGAKFTKKQVSKKKTTMKLRMDDKIVWTRKPVKAPYINERVKAMDELTVEEALTRHYKDSEGNSVRYKRSDLIYDVCIPEGSN